MAYNYDNETSSSASLRPSLDYFDTLRYSISDWDFGRSRLTKEKYEMLKATNFTAAKVLGFDCISTYSINNKIKGLEKTIRSREDYADGMRSSLDIAKENSHPFMFLNRISLKITEMLTKNINRTVEYKDELYALRTLLSNVKEVEKYEDQIAKDKERARQREQELADQITALEALAKKKKKKTKKKTKKKVVKKTKKK
jgi:hypothetical protein